MKIKRYHFEVIDSTNTWAKANAKLFKQSELTLVTAARQTLGKGRLGRTWHSPAGQNIYATFCFFMDPQRKDIGNLPQIMALSAAEILALEGFEPKLKWPNDILLNNKKVGGILTETSLEGEQLFIALGIGLNVNMLPEEAVEIERPVTSLLMESIETGKIFVVDELLQKLAKNFQDKLQKFYSDGFTPFLESYRNRIVHSLHGELSFRDSQKTWVGYFEKINPDGSLMMKLPNGELKAFIAGELV